MNPGMKMMLMQRTAQERGKEQSEYGGGNRRMIGYDRESNGNAATSNYAGMESQNRQRGGNGRYMAGDGFDNPPLAVEYDERKYGRGGGEMARMGGYNTENRRRRDSRGRYMMGGMDYDDDEETRGYSARMMGGYPQMHGGNKYGDIYAEGTIYAPGAMNKPMGMHRHEEDMEEPMDEQMAMQWVRKMKADNGAPMPVFKPDQTEQQRKTFCPDCEKWEFFVAMNMMYADYCDAGSKLGVDKPEFYARLAKGFLCDKDAGEGKLQKYLKVIPK